MISKAQYVSKSSRGQSMNYQSKSKKQNRRILVIAGVGLILLAGCENGQGFSPLKSQSGASASAATPAGKPQSNQAPQDVEAPNIFNKTDMGLWDGRPSLGGIWVAHPDVTTPQRVIIRNTTNNKSVVGALFRRERSNPGPAIQVSSDAANELGMLAGAPAKLSVIALKREEVAPPPPEPEAVPEAAPVEEATAIEPVTPTETPPAPAPEKPAKPAKASATSATSGEIEQTELDPVANAAAALDEVDGASDATATPAPAAKPKLFALQKPFVQAGTFSVEENANNAAGTLRGIGMNPVVKTQGTGDDAVWRVLVGPAASRAERRAMLKDIKGIGFDDAYFVTQ